LVGETRIIGRNGGYLDVDVFSVKASIKQGLKNSLPRAGTFECSCERAVAVTFGRVWPSILSWSHVAHIFFAKGNLIEQVACQIPDSLYLEI
jgi:hypothetical protein